MFDRSSCYTERERVAAMLAVRQLVPQVGALGARLIVEAVAGVLGMREEGARQPAAAAAPFQPMNTAPRDRDVELQKPKGQIVRAIWWKSWGDQQASDGVQHPWAWREARPDGTVGAPVDEATGWRDLP